MNCVRGEKGREGERRRKFSTMEELISRKVKGLKLRLLGRNRNARNFNAIYQFVKITRCMRVCTYIEIDLIKLFASAVSRTSNNPVLILRIRNSESLSHLYTVIFLIDLHREMRGDPLAFVKTNTHLNMM